MRLFRNSIYIECYRCAQRSLLRNVQTNGADNPPTQRFPH